MSFINLRAQDTTVSETSNMHENPLVKLEDIELIYSSSEQPALNRISLEISSGERICLLGANGSGKSTLSKVIAGIMAPDSGRVEYQGKTAFDSDGVNSEAYMQARRNIAYVFQDPEDQIVARIVEEDVAFGPENKALSTEKIRELVDLSLHTVAMSDYALADISELSGGQQQRVAIASALAMEPSLFIADEPSSMLDIRGRRETMRLLGKMQEQGCAIVHVTHFVEEAQFANKIILLEKGTKVFEGTYSELMENSHFLKRQNLELPFEMKLKEALRQNESSCDTTTSKKSSLKDNEVQIHVSDLGFSYSNKYQALSSISLNIHKGEFVCLIGQTGSGKTTLAKTLAALNPNFSGTIDVFGQSLAAKKTRSMLQGRIGYIMQKPERQLFAETVLEDVAYGPRCQGLSEEEITKRVDQALQTLGIENLKDKSPFELSGGQQRLVAIAGILSMEPEVLILDEPCASLDSAASCKLLSILKDLNTQGLTCIMVTHSMEDAAYMADTIYVLSKGQVVLQGTPDQVFRHQETLDKIGLGIPEAKSYAQALNDKYGWSLKEALTFDELVDEIRRVGVEHELV